MGMVSTALLSQTLISQFSPKAIAMTGICAGVEGKVKGGDILFADPVWDYQSGKLVAAPGGGTMLKIDPTQHQADPVVKSNVENLFNEELMIQIYKGYKGDKSQLQVPNLLVGPVASGSMVLSDGQTMKKIQDQHRKLIGVEMEVFGLYAAAHCAPNPRPAVFALKSVCDFGDPEKNDIYQQYASYTSAKALQILMESKASAIIS
jgi:nucleoside phosphorylase